MKQEGKRARLCLENTCPQLPTVPPEKLFDRFYRGDAARTQKEGGYGIGLAVARSLAQANQGSLHAQYLPPQAIGLWRNSPTEHAKPKDGPQPAARLFFF